MKKAMKLILTGFLPAVVFSVADFFFKPVYLAWSQLPLIALFDAIMSVGFALSFCFAFNFKRKKKTGAVLFLIGLILCNAVLWGVSNIINVGGSFNRLAIGWTNIALFACVALFTLIVFIRNTEKGASRIPGIIAVAALLVCGLTNITLLRSGDYEKKYDRNIEKVGFFENTLETAYPQTCLYKLVNDHFTSGLPEGKTVKKCLIMGYDGARADLFSLPLAEDGAAKTLLDGGGHAYLSYCGGVEYPAKNTQATSTAPGWCSILTGQWGDKTGVTDNGIVKPNDYLTNLTTLVEDKTVSSSSFYTVWGGHFANEDSTYYNEKLYIKDNNLNTEFIRCGSDDETFSLVRENVERTVCDDYIFYIFEHCDSNGHGTGFNLKNKNYTDGFTASDTLSGEILKSIKSRKTYAEEDWLFIITSDHGGIGTGHGGATKQERFTFIVTNAEIK